MDSEHDFGDDTAKTEDVAQARRTNFRFSEDYMLVQVVLQFKPMVLAGDDGSPTHSWKDVVPAMENNTGIIRDPKQYTDRLKGLIAK